MRGLVYWVTVTGQDPEDPESFGPVGVRKTERGAHALAAKALGTRIYGFQAIGRSPFTILEARAGNVRVRIEPRPG